MRYTSINFREKLGLFILNTGHEGGERTAQNDVWI